MQIRKTKPYRTIINRNKLLALALLAYTATVFLAGLLFYRSGEYRKYQTLLLPFSSSFRERPIKTILNQLSSSTPLVFDVNHLNTLKIAQKQKEAMQNEELFVSEDDWVNAQISYGKERLKAKIRLKGQFKDHWREDGLWSYKVKVREGKTLFGMDKFAVQHPRTRSFINEWVYHQLIKDNGIVSLRYNFLPLIINGKKLPAFAIEENFGTRMLENNKRREGPIFRLQIRVSPEERFVNTISFYQINKFSSSIRGRDLMRRAERLVSSFMNGDLPASEVFDIKLMAKAFAISDLFGDDHALLAYNMRYYLNPISGLIEPVPYDQQNIINLSKKGLVGERYMHNSPENVISNNLISMIFQDKDFSLEYGKALNLISKKSYLDNFFTRIDQDLEQKMSLLQKSYTRYEFKEKSILYSNQEYISSLLRPRKPLEAYLLNSDKDKNKITMKITNMHTLPIEIKYINSSKKENIQVKTNSDLITNRYKVCNGTICDKQFAPIKKYQNIQLNLDTPLSSFNYNQLRIVGNVVGSDFSFDVPVYSPSEYFTKFDTINDFNELDFVSLDTQNKIISFNKTDIKVSTDLKIPKGYTLNISKGTNIDLINDSSIISYSPVNLTGTIESPIVLTSSDNTGQGLLVVNADTLSTLNHVKFSNLQLINKLGLNLTGSITFFNSDVLIDNSSFDTLNAEDSLNIISSNFSISNTSFKNTKSDAIDIDFSNGNLFNLNFNSIGNDALDFSGSYIKASDISINSTGDKGISIGENSQVTIDKVFIQKSIIGIAVKDDSKLIGDNITIKESTVGIAGYNKKDWFGGSETSLTNSIVKQNSDNFLNETGSIMNINNIPIKPNIFNLYKNFYSLP